VIAQAAAATLAAPAIAIDLTDHSTARMLTLASDPHKFMSQHSGKPHVTASQLQIRLTDPSSQDVDNHLARPWRWIGVIADETQLMVHQCDSLHGDNSRVRHGLDQAASGV
jgi:hypothetical protein